MYPYLDFFNEPENQEMEYADDLEAGDQDLRFHLNAHTGSDRAHPAEPRGNPRPELPIVASIHSPHTSWAVPWTPAARTESGEGTEYDSPPRKSAFDRLRPLARERLGCGKKAVGPAIGLFPVIAGTQKAAAPARVDLEPGQEIAHLYCWRQRAGFIHPMQVMNNPVTSDAYRVWYHTHGKLFIGNPEHRQDQGYVQCGASLNEAMHYIREMHISTGEAREDRARALDLVRELHISSREHLERAGYAYYGRPNSSFCGSYSQADFGGLSQYTPASQVYDPSQPGSSHHNAPSNILPQFGGQNRPAYNTSPWPHPVGDFIVEDYSS
nr:serine/threonine-protein phosphatase 7 long form homolog [Ipomoea batatas]